MGNEEKMNKINKQIFLILMMHVCVCINIIAQKTVSSKISPEIIANNSTHIVRIAKDSVLVVTGSTFSFTVDTPEDSGLVSTNTTVKQLISEIRSKHGSAQQYLVTDKDGNKKDEGYLLNGDRLTVTSQDSKSKKTYKIAAVAMALSSQLQLEKKELTVNTNSDLTLYFTAGQRSPNVTVKIFIPEGITITEDNTTVNVIGRGVVKLKDLATQSIGRVGGNYSYKKVGNFSITKLPDGSSLLLFKHLDLRPANGADLTIVISNVYLSSIGNYIFKAGYATSKPEVLTSGETETTLTVTRTIADLERVVEKSLQYKESADRYTKASFKWSAIKRGAAIQLVQSTDNGKTWAHSSSMIDAEKGSVTISNLIRGKL